jgi:hypothetical protein
MVTFQISPIISTERRRKYLASPTGSYYMTKAPTLELAQELVGLGMTRLVFGETGEDSPEVFRFLEESGVEVVDKSEPLV